MSLNFGGHIRFTYAGTPLRVRGKFELEELDLDISVGTNEDGSIFQTGKPRATMIAMDFEDSNPANNSAIVNWRQIMLGGPYNIMISEDDTGVLHTCANAKLGGRLKTDRLTGAISGLEIHVPYGSYTKTAS